jgi:hypothetical protein
MSGPGPLALRDLKLGFWRSNPPDGGPEFFCHGRSDLGREGGADNSFFASRSNSSGLGLWKTRSFGPHFALPSVRDGKDRGGFGGASGEADCGVPALLPMKSRRP